MPRSGSWPSPTISWPYEGIVAPVGPRKPRLARTLDRHVRRKMIEPGLPDLSVGKQCALLSISRSSFYHEPKGETDLTLDLMRLIDTQFLETPFYGVGQMTWHLRNEEQLVNEKPIRRLMRLMGLMPLRCPAVSCAAMHEREPKAQHPQAREGAQDLPLFAARLAGGSTEPGLGGGHHLPANATRVPLPCRHHGLVHPQGLGLAHFRHAPSRRLPAITCRSTGRRTFASRR